MRRHLTTAQKAEVVLKLAEIEEERARRRQEATQLAGKDKNGKPLFKSSVVGQEPPTEDKGRSIELAVKKARDQGLLISDKTVKKAKKILEVAKQDPEIKKEWEKAKAGNPFVLFDVWTGQPCPRKHRMSMGLCGVCPLLDGRGQDLTQEIFFRVKPSFVMTHTTSSPFLIPTA
ncbi:MAG: hypothetical protein SBU_000095 [Candidatus Syntrophoarchaeum butanivorans]|uniref:Uncharacterized protein n=1 Tax=Candidatus Syntropharchaeum butanivorans TaxID=1839936 RepID=A0A1F2P747_9EURY|nr:MAG: hypothetical protein SBU_000095 [Candidatus Syntrophoarchaeum butanivorans]